MINCKWDGVHQRSICNDLPQAILVDKKPHPSEYLTNHALVCEDLNLRAL